MVDSRHLHGPSDSVTIRNAGHAKTRRSAGGCDREKQCEDIIDPGRCLSDGRGTYAWPRVFDDSFAFTARSAQATGVAKQNENRRHLGFAVIAPPIGRRCASCAADTGFLGEPIDPVYEDRELFADFLTTYYTDWEPESSFVVEGLTANSAVICSAPASHCCNQLYAFWQNVSLFRQGRSARYPRYNERSRRFIRWTSSTVGGKCPRRPRRIPHFHINLLPEARKMSTTRAS